MQPANTNGIQVVFVQQPNWTTQGVLINIRNDFAKKFITLGSLHIAFGGLCIIFQAVRMGILANRLHDGHGFWIGIQFIVTGSFGIVGGQRKIRGLVIAFNALSILSAAFATVLLCLAAPSAAYAFPYYGRYYYYGRAKEIATFVMDMFLVILALAEGIVSILSSVICCKVGVCCDCCNCCETCCPPSNYAAQSAVPAQLMGQSIEAQQQPFVVYTASNQQQFPMMANQQPMFFAMASDQKQLMIDQSVQQQRDQEPSERDKLVEEA